MLDVPSLGVQARFAESRRLAARLPCPQWTGADPRGAMEPENLVLVAAPSDSPEYLWSTKAQTRSGRTSRIRIASECETERLKSSEHLA